MPIELEQLRFPVSYIQLVKRIADYKNQDSQNSLKQLLDIDDSAIDDPKALIDGIQMAKILDVIQQFISEDPEGQKQLMKFFPLTIHGYVGLAAMTEENIRKSLEIVERYFYQVMPAFEMVSSIENERYTIRFNRVANFKENNNLLQELVMCGIQSGISFSEIPSNQIEVKFAHESLVLSDVKELNPESALALGANENSISLPVSFLGSKVTTASDVTSKLMKQELENVRTRLDQQHTLSYRVSTLINDKIKSNEQVDLLEISKILGFSSRSLSRHLKNEGTSFKTAHNNCRLALAESLLTESDQSVSQIAFKLGFLNEASFSRYFKQQKNKSPIQYRSDIRK